MNRCVFVHGLCLLVFTISSAHPTWANTYYVAPDGQDDHPGLAPDLGAFEFAGSKENSL